MTENIKNSIEQYGKTISVTTADGAEVSTPKAFIQPLRSDYQSPLYEDYQNDKSTEQFLYIGLPETNLSDMPSGTLLKSDSNVYEIKMIEKVYISEEVAYERAVLEKHVSQ